MLYSYQWKPVEDLPEGWKLLVNAELASLGNVWLEQRDQLKQTEAVQKFNQELHREWSIETGVIEGLYTLDRGVTRLLIERGIDPSLIPASGTNRSPEMVAAIIRDHQDVVEGLFDFVARERSLSTSYIKELHATLTQHQPTCTAMNPQGQLLEVPLRRGDWKLQPNNPTRPDGAMHQYCPPEHVAAEMDRLVKLHLEHDVLGVPPEVESAWLHHRFAQIHPFMDGNGRVARCLASLVLIRSNLFPVVITRDIRTPYIDALEAADAGDLRPLTAMMVRVQKAALIHALSAVERTLREDRVQLVVEAAKRDLLRRREERLDQWEVARKHATALWGIAWERLRGTAAMVKGQLGKLLEDFECYENHEPTGGEKSHYHFQQVVQTARTLDYFANLREYHAWTRLVLKSDRRAEILLSFHAVGQDYRGLMGASASFFWRLDPEAGPSGTVALSDEVFQINYLESEDQVRQRFNDWLESVLAVGLETWRQGI